MRSRALPAVALSAAALIVGTMFGGTANASTGITSSHSGAAVAPSGYHITAKGCGFSQNDPTGDTGTAIVSQNFEPANDAFDATAADDFACKRDAKIKVVTTTGQYFNGSGPADSVNVLVRKNKGGEPTDGKAVCTLKNQPYTDTSGIGSLKVTLTKACSLKKGVTYWMEVSVNMDFSVGGEWGWENTTETAPGKTLANNPADWRNPGDGFATGCTVYQNGIDMQTCLGGVAPGPNFMFAVK